MARETKHARPGRPRKAPEERVTKLDDAWVLPDVRHKIGLLADMLAQREGKRISLGDVVTRGIDLLERKVTKEGKR